MEVHECPLENDFDNQINKNEAYTALELTLNKKRRWYCINPEHPRLMDDTVTFTKCFESECYYLRKVL